MYQNIETDFFGRLRGIFEYFGAVGFFGILFLAIIAAILVFRYGSGPVLFLLFITYALSAVMQGGVVFLTTVLRWFCLILCILGLYKMQYRPKASMLLFAFYALLGLFFVSRSAALFWSLQRAALLVLVLIAIPIAVCNYIVTPDRIKSLFKMGIIAATIWIGVSFLYFQDFLNSSNLQFGGDVVVGVAWAGAFFWPMVLWGIFQRKLFWRIYCAMISVPIIFLLFIGGVRTAIFGMLIIGSLPLLISKIRPVKIIGLAAGISVLALVIRQILYAVTPGKATALTEKVLSSSTSGRTELWLEALHRCKSAIFMGNGTGSADLVAREMGLGFHNAFLVIWYDTSMIGLLLVLLFLFIYTVRSFLTIRRSQNSELGDFSRISLGYMLGITAICMFENSITSSSGVAVFMLILITSLIDRIRQMEGQYQFEMLGPQLEYTDDASLST